MPVIHFTAADALQTTVVPANIYPTEVSKTVGPQKSNSGKSIHYFLDFTITDGQYKGKTRTVIFNSESNNVSMLGDMQFFPQSHLLLLHSAISGRDVKPEDFALDLDELVNKPLEVAWGVQTVDGHLVNVINAFHPKGYSSQAPAF